MIPAGSESGPVLRFSVLALLGLDGVLCAVATALLLPSYLGPVPFPVSALAGGLVAVLSCGAFLSAAWYPPLWIFVGLMAALARVTIRAEARG